MFIYIYILKLNFEIYKIIFFLKNYYIKLNIKNINI